MPNIAYNNVVIVGSKEDMKPITDRVDEIREHGLMRTFYPLPKEFEEIETGNFDDGNGGFKKYKFKDKDEYPTEEYMKELKTKYGFDNWYDWSNYHYGTKWGDGVRQDEVPVQVIEKDDEVIVRIETDSAWSPISQGLRYLASPGSSIDKNIRFYNLSTEEQYLWCDLTIDMPFVHRHFYDDHNFSKENGWKGFIEKIKDHNPDVYESVKEVYDYEIGSLWKSVPKLVEEHEKWMKEVEEFKNSDHFKEEKTND